MLGKLRERIKPANTADETLTGILVRADANALAAMRHLLPTAMAEALGSVLAGTAKAEDLRQLGRMLASAGLVSAAVTLFESCAAKEDVPPAGKALLYADMAALKRALGMNFAAAADDRTANRLSGVVNSGAALPELDDGPFSVRCAFVDPQGYRTMLEGLPQPVLQDDALRDPYFTKTHFLNAYAPLGRAEDFSFFVVDEDNFPVLLVECDVLGNRHLGCRETGIELTVLRPDLAEWETVQALVLRQLNLIAAWAGCPSILFDFPQDRILKRVSMADSGTTIHYRKGWVDLDLDEAEIERAYRQTTRQSVRWGRQNMRVLTHEDGLDIPALYGELHEKSGRLCALPPDIMAESLRQGRLSAFVGYYQDQPSAMVVSSHHGSTTYDMAAVKLPLGKQPLTHILIHSAILDAKRRGQRRFDFGPLWDNGQLGAKMKAIATFKAGFITAHQQRVLVTWAV